MDSGTNATPPPPKTVFLTVLSNSELQKTVKNRSLVAGGVAFEILQCWEDVHLQTSEYSQQVKYSGQVTTITENVQCSLSYPWDWSILCSGKCAVCSMKQSVRNVQCTLTGVKCTLNGAQCVVCSVQCAVFSVQRAVVDPSPQGVLVLRQQQQTSPLGRVSVYSTVHQGGYLYTLQHIREDISPWSHATDSSLALLHPN